MRQRATDKMMETSLNGSRGSARFVDLHCHCLPNFDDGPGSMRQAIALCRARVCDNIGAVVAMPHQLGRFEGRTTVPAIRNGTERLRQHLGDEDIDLKVFPGAEVRLDERLSTLLAQRAVLTLADMNRHVLLELPETVFINIEPLLVQCARDGIDVIIAHAERNAPMLDHPGVLQRWIECGAGLQVTAAGLAGRFGSDVEQAAWQLIDRGWVVAVATDAHDCTGLGMSKAHDLVGVRCGVDLAHLLCIENPTRVLIGDSCVRIPAQQSARCGDVYRRAGMDMA
jgi:protein-tyrosine phosphatase